MKTAAIAMLMLAGTLAGLSSAANAYQVSHLRQYQGVSQDAYNRCFQLALARGETTSNGNRRSLDLFIDSCLRGKIPF